jgi:hypothetical protein
MHYLYLWKFIFIISCASKSFENVNRGDNLENLSEGVRTILQLILNKQSVVAGTGISWLGIESNSEV